MNYTRIETCIKAIEKIEGWSRDGRVKKYTNKIAGIIYMYMYISTVALQLTN